MTVARHYKMQASEEKADALLHGLTALAEAVKAIPGCVGVDILQDLDEPNRFVFIEKWVSVDAHKEGGSMVPQDVMGRVMVALTGRPEAAYLQYQPTGTSAS